MDRYALVLDWKTQHCKCASSPKTGLEVHNNFSQKTPEVCVGRGLGEWTLQADFKICENEGAIKAQDIF